MTANDYLFWGSDPSIEKAHTNGQLYEEFIRWAFKKDGDNKQNGADARYMCDLIRSEQETTDTNERALQIVKTHINRGLDQLLFRIEGNFIQDMLVQLKIQTHKARHSEQLIEVINETMGMLGPKKVLYKE